MVTVATVHHAAPLSLSSQLSITNYYGNTVEIRDSTPQQIRPLKKLKKPDRPIKHPHKASMDKYPADTPSKKSLRNQRGPGRHHGFLQDICTNEN